MSVYALYSSPHHAPVPDHLPTLIVTPHGKADQILYTYLHTNYNRENYLLTPSPQGDLCVAKLFPPPPRAGGKSSSSDGHGGGNSNLRSVKCEASRNFRWTITNSGVMSPTYKLTLPSEDGSGGLADEQPLFQISKTNPSSPFWTMWYYAYAGHLIPPKRIQFGHISKSITPDGKPVTGGGTRVTITGKSEDEKAVWKTLGEGNEDMVEWAVISAALHVLDDEIVKAAEAAGIRIGVMPGSNKSPGTATPPMPGNMPKPTLHPTGQQPGRAPPVNAGPPMIPNSRGPPAPQQMQGPPPQQRQGPPPPLQQMQQPPRSGQSPHPPPSPGMDPRLRQQQQQQGPPPPRDPRMPMQNAPPPHMQQPPHPQAQGQQGPPGGLMAMRNGQSPRPPHSPMPGQGGPPPPGHQGGPPPMRGNGPAGSPPQNGMPHPNGMISPNMQHRPLPGQQAPSPYPPNGNHPPHHHPAMSPGPSQQQQQQQQARSAPPSNLSQMRTRPPLPPPGSSAPSNSLPPPGSAGSQQPYANGSNPIYNTRSIPNTPSRRDQQQTANYPSPRSRERISPTPPAPQGDDDEDTIDSVAFMLGTTALNDAASTGRQPDNQPQQQYHQSSTGGIGSGREPVKGGYNSRVQRALQGNRDR